MRKQEIIGLRLVLFHLVLLTGCGLTEKRTNENALFTTLEPEMTGIEFVNEVQDQMDFNIFNYRNFYNGGGVAIGDVNNDGFPDIYLTANMNKNSLYLNAGDWKFQEIAAKAGVQGTKNWSTGVTMADVNGDGWLDIYVCNSGDVKGANKENELFINNGDLTFTEKAAEYGLNDKGYSTHASFFDYDQDGDLDCYLLNNSFKSVDRVELFTQRREARDEEGGDKLFRNDGDHFTDVSVVAGIYGGSVGFGLGVSVNDLNGDMLPDIYVANDFWERDYLYINKGDGTFSEEIINRTSLISGSSMGADIADLNNDGHPEIFTTEMLPPDNYRIKTMTRFDETNVKELKVKSDYHTQVLQNCLHFNDGTGNFQELGAISNTMATDWSWGALIFDMDNNGWKDIFVSNGILRDITSMDFASFVSDRENIKKVVLEKGKFDLGDLLSYMPSTKIANYAFINQRNRTFLNGSDSLGLGEPSHSNGAAYGDLDNDGDLDLVVNNVNMEAFVYRNNSEKRPAANYLKLEFEGPERNPFGIGAKAIAYSGKGQQVLQNFNTRGFESSVEPSLLFGLGEVATLDSLRVIWPDLKTELLKDVKSNQTLQVKYKEAIESSLGTAPIASPWLEEVTAQILIGNYTHRENDFNDFDYERLLPHKVSTEGPRIVTGDMNGDKLEDFVLLGAFGDRDKLYFQEKNGTFVERLQESILLDSIYESTSGVLFDADDDDDLDLLIGSGGNEFDRGMKAYYIRFYKNDGKGNFEHVIGQMPPTIGNFSCIKAADFDQDGDDDLFIGGRIVPGNYGLIPRSFLFKNNGKGSWEDISPNSLGGMGMVTDAAWSDFNHDGNLDLVVVGEWLPVTVFLSDGTSLAEGQGLPDTEGWWNTIEAADLNKDGRDEYVLGNWGLNSKFRATPDQPLTMYVKDFDNNGKSEFIINWYPPADKTAYPFASKMDITTQIPVIKKNAVTYEQYSRQTYETMFTEDQRKGAFKYKTSTLESVVLWNKSEQIEIKSLPLEAQVSPIYSILAEDLDNDGHMDLLVMGNCYGLKPEVGRQDSNHGIVLKGDGQGNFISLTSQETGLYMNGEVRDIALLNGHGGEKKILIARNNATARVYQRNAAK